MTNQEVLNLNQALNNVGNLKGVKFAYAVSKNLNLIKVEVEALNTALKAGEKFTEFDTKRVELCKRLADKDEKDNPKMENNAYTITENKKKFDKELESLREEYKAEIDEREKQIEKFNEMLKEESAFAPFKIKLAQVPDEITVAQYNNIKSIIEE